jgi:hypothetical protein
VNKILDKRWIFCETTYKKSNEYRKALRVGKKLKNNEMEKETIITIVICICIFFAIREVMAWYFKINKILSNQDLIISFLAEEEAETDSEYEDETLS